MSSWQHWVIGGRLMYCSLRSLRRAVGAVHGTQCACCLARQQQLSTSAATWNSMQPGTTAQPWMPRVVLLHPYAASLAPIMVLAASISPPCCCWGSSSKSPPPSCRLVHSKCCTSTAAQMMLTLPWRARAHGCPSGMHRAASPPSTCSRLIASG